jgi:hypothetical protein
MPITGGTIESDHVEVAAVPEGSGVTVLQEILEWSKDRPQWQRDALRRLVTDGELSDDDIRALTEICKSAHGLAEPQEVTPLAAGHVTATAIGAAPVALAQIRLHSPAETG